MDLDLVELVQRERAAEWREVDVHVPLVLPHLGLGFGSGSGSGSGLGLGSGLG